MRIRVVNRETKEQKSFPSIAKAVEYYGTTRARLEKAYTIFREYPSGYWADYDKEFLKSIGKANSPTTRCLLVD